MKNRVYVRTILSLALAVAMLLAFGTAAYADGDEAKAAETAVAEESYAAPELRLAPNSFAAKQYYEFDEESIQVCTVRLAAGISYAGAAALRDQMLAQGYDSFIYNEDGVLYVMCGKFGNLYDAMCYNESIHKNTDCEDAYVTNAKLPGEPVWRFANTFYSAVTIDRTPGSMETGWEKPTGSFFRGTEADAQEVYTVQLCRGTSFISSERLRDKVLAAGYPAFVYKDNMEYFTMVGAFENRDDAKAFSRELRWKGFPGVVLNARIPAAELANFQVNLEG